MKLKTSQWGNDQEMPQSHTTDMAEWGRVKERQLTAAWHLEHIKRNCFCYVISYMDNVKNCNSTNILRYTAGNSLTSILRNISLDDVRHYTACNAPIWDETGYTFGNHILRLHSSIAVKRNYRTYIRRYTSQKGSFLIQLHLSSSIFPFIWHIYSSMLDPKYIHSSNKKEKKTLSDLDPLWQTFWIRAWFCNLV